MKLCMSTDVRRLTFEPDPDHTTVVAFLREQGRKSPLGKIPHDVGKTPHDVIMTSSYE